MDFFAKVLYTEDIVKQRVILLHKIINKLVRFAIKTVNHTGLEQDLNSNLSGSGLAISELAEVSRIAAAESAVLLKNDNNMLPIKDSDTVAVFGRTAIDYFTVGYGSGGDVIAPYKISLMEGLRRHKVRLDETLALEYASWCKKNTPDDGFWGHWPMCYPEMKISENSVEKSSKIANKALIVIGRAAGEDRENLLKKGSFYLNDNEIRLLELVTKHFENVCVILDCGNIIDMSHIAALDDKISAIVYAWQGGMESGIALADVLTGSVNPSGRLTDTIALNYEDYPSASDFGNKKFNNYSEDIFVGYRYFETFNKAAVLYPFGYGLSYTNFKIKYKSIIKDNHVSISAKVENIGDCPGKCVVQAYLQVPNDIISAPARVLTSFGKTKLLKSGEIQVLDLSFNMEDFAVYDDSGITGNKSCYVLPEGEYCVFAGENIRSCEKINYTLKHETQVIKQLTPICSVDKETAFDVLGNKKNKTDSYPVYCSGKDLRSVILNNLPEEIQMTKEKIHFDSVLSGEKTVEEFVATLSYEELDDISHGQGKMNSEYGIVGNAGAFGGVTPSLREKGLPAVITTDGPSGIRIKKTVALLPCGTALASTFNTELVEKLYSLVALEMKHFGSDMLLAPGMNIHRNPLCGRNFEYYSEDPYVSGKIAAAAIRGIQSAGGSACPKHFACNNQETNRNKNDSRLSERALREIYLKGFEIAVKESKPLSIMTSYNKVNGVWSHYNYDLVTTVLRGEWGYEGVVITDWWMQADVSHEFPEICNDAYRIRAQVDVLMPGEFNKAKKAEEARSIVPSLKKGTLTVAEAQRTAINVINFILKLKK